MCEFNDTHRRAAMIPRALRGAFIFILLNIPYSPSHSIRIVQMPRKGSFTPAAKVTIQGVRGT